MPHCYRHTWQDTWCEATGETFTPDRFVAATGVSVAVVAAIWALIGPDVAAEAGLKPKHLLWLLNWLKEYKSWDEACCFWHTSDHTYRNYVWDMLDLLNAQLDLVHLSDRFDMPFENCAFLVIDSTLCPVAVNRKDWEHQKPYYSVLHATHGLKYELAVHWLTGRLHWIAGGVFASMSDITITRASTFLHYLLPGERVLADKGYAGEQQLLTPFKGKYPLLSPVQRAWNHLMNPPRTIVENAFARFHKFKILSISFRGALANHPFIFRAIAQIVQLDIETHPLRSDVLEMPLRHRFYTDDDLQCDLPGWLQHMQFRLVHSRVLLLNIEPLYFLPPE